MNLLPGVAERLAAAKAPAPARREVHYPRAPTYSAERLTYVTTAAQMENFLALAHQRPLAHIGFDSEFRYDTPGVSLDKGKKWHDPRAIHPLLFSFALVETETDRQGRIYPFVVDVRDQNLVVVLAPLFQVPVCFACHFAKVELFCLWQRGLPEPRQLWDTWVHERARSMGPNHARYRMPREADEAEEAEAKTQAQAVDDARNTLTATCRRYGLAYGMEDAKEQLQRSFLTHPPDQDFTAAQIDYAAEDAVAAAGLYPRQVQAATQSGILHHLVQIEMPWTTANARMEWHGVRPNPDKREQLRTVATAHAETLAQQLAAEHGIANARSHVALKAFADRAGLLERFRRPDGGKGYSFDKDQLKSFQEHHPAISLIRQARFAADLPNHQVLAPELVGVDGRLHPVHRQLGTDTGRQTSQFPNVLGLNRILRPLIIPDPGYGIGEVDWSQMEVGVTAAMYDDERMIEMFNTGDVYSALAQFFYAEELSPEDGQLPGADFKQRHPDKRDHMKSCTLGLIYGITPHGLARQLHIPLARAGALQEQFMTLFPSLQQGLAAIPVAGAARGYASTMTGLRRYRGKSGALTGWERRWMINHPVQGTAAALLKLAGNELDRRYPAYGARLLIPLHDAFVFEAPLDHFDEVVTLTHRVMCDAVQAFFPKLWPRADVNREHPDCWNKEGQAEALDQWIADPTTAL